MQIAYLQTINNLALIIYSSFFHILFIFATNLPKFFI
uniref:Uncharacterized protein n=1 Tax=virus sp. ctPYc18 TaxID=2828251 RepID=A0A8S5RDK9_9VIRU|nr:MAG TPA: hypothetical protein [virus sp. ctPYc18]